MGKDIPVKILVVAPATNSIQVEWEDAMGNSETHWLPLAENVKVAYCKKGPATISTEDREDGKTYVTFCKSAIQSNTGFTGPTKSTFGAKPTPQSPKSIQAFNSADPIQQRMSALKFAGNIYEGLGKEADAKSLTEDALKFLETGSWEVKAKTEKINEAKHIQQGKVPIEDEPGQDSY